MNIDERFEKLQSRLELTGRFSFLSAMVCVVIITTNISGEYDFLFRIGAFLFVCIAVFSIILIALCYDVYLQRGLDILYIYLKDLEKEQKGKE